MVQESYDPVWQAWSSGQRLPIRKDAMGFMAIDAPPGDQMIRLNFPTPFENRVGQGLTAITALVVLALLVGGLRKEQIA